MKTWIPFILILFAAGCRGTKPVYYGDSRLGFGAVLIGARVILPTGESREGFLAINLESKSEQYRLIMQPGKTSLFRVEPDTYRLHPQRSLFGKVQSHLKMKIGGRTYHVPFPREILRKESINIRPTKVFSIGVLEARLLPIQQGRERKITLRMDDSIDTRRELVEDMIHKQMDAKASFEERDSSVSWIRALEQSLIQIQGESERRRPYKAPR